MTQTMQPMGAQTAAAYLDMEYMLCRIHGDLRNVLAELAELTGQHHKAPEYLFKAMLSIQQCQSELDPAFRKAAETNCDLEGEPPF